jgi:acyl transferase domain-containing protein
MKARHGNFLEKPWSFDHEFFNISPREAKAMDPQQKLLLQGAIHALDDAGYVPGSTASFGPATMGCYIGIATDDYVQNLQQDIDVYYTTGMSTASTHGQSLSLDFRDITGVFEREDLVRLGVEWSVTRH